MTGERETGLLLGFAIGVLAAQLVQAARGAEHSSARKFFGRVWERAGTWLRDALHGQMVGAAAWDGVPVTLGEESPRGGGHERAGTMRPAGERGPSSGAKRYDEWDIRVRVPMGSTPEQVGRLVADQLSRQRAVREAFRQAGREGTASARVRGRMPEAPEWGRGAWDGVSAAALDAQRAGCISLSDLDVAVREYAGEETPTAEEWRWLAEMTGALLRCETVGTETMWTLGFFGWRDVRSTSPARAIRLLQWLMAPETRREMAAECWHGGAEDATLPTETAHGAPSSRERSDDAPEKDRPAPVRESPPAGSHAENETEARRSWLKDEHGDPKEWSDQRYS